MKTLKVPATNKQLRKMLTQAHNGTVVLTADGKPMAALISIEGMDAESLALGTNPKFLGIIEQSLKELAKGQRISLADMRARLGVAD